MYDIPLPLTRENIYKEIDSYQIFKFYCPNFKNINKSFVSDIRQDDANPSARISKIGGDLLYTDFGKGSYRAINYVMEKFGLSYYHALKKINQDFGLGLGFDVSPVKNKNNIPKTVNLDTIPDKSPTIIRIKSIPWNDVNSSYWMKYGWTVEMLKEARIIPISHYWIHNDRIQKGYIAGGCSYSIEYYWHENVFRRKLYFPLKKENRFLTNADSSVVQGYHLLPRKGNLLIITKSIKDCGVFWRLGVNAISSNTETAFLPEAYLEKLKQRWNTIVVWFDNDITGIKKGREFAERYSLRIVTNPLGSPYKDPSDYVEHQGLEMFRILMNKTLHLCSDIFLR